MRQWVEKLAEVSKNEGTYSFGEIRVRDFTWCKMSDNTIEIYDGNGIGYSYRCLSFKIYEDEADLLSEVTKVVKTKTRDYFIEHINEF